MNGKRKEYIRSCEISFSESAPLGGYNQKFAAEGKRKDLPLLICLHGGPGSPIPFCVGCRGLFPALTDNFIMVYWDQLGCGANNRPIGNEFTINHFSVMTEDLIKLMKKRFPENKLYLFGLSWGSILAALSASSIPELINGVVTYGQVISAPMSSEDAFDTIASSSAPEKYKEFAEKLRFKKSECSLNDKMKLSKIIRKYTEGYNNHNSKPAPVGDIIKGFISSPDYGFKDFAGVFKNGYAKNESLTNEMVEIDLRNTFKNISLPYHIFQGETDIVTSTKDITEFVNGCGNPNIDCTVLKNNGHFPGAGAL